MEIQKIFSNTENEEEKLYSVLMTEDEVALYSELQKEFNSQAQKVLRKELEEKAGNGNSILGRQLLKDQSLAAEMGSKVSYNKKTGLPRFTPQKNVNAAINGKASIIKSGGEIVSGKTGKIVNKYIPGSNNTQFIKSITKSHTPTSKKIIAKAKSFLR
jgi:phosphopantetheinyl transferase (holo-ACP synthase)